MQESLSQIMLNVENKKKTKKRHFIWKLIRRTSPYKFRNSPKEIRKVVDVVETIYLDELPVDVLLEIFSVYLQFNELKNICYICKRFNVIVNKSNLWKACCRNEISSLSVVKIEKILFEINRDWKWVASSINLPIPKRTIKKSNSNKKSNSGNNKSLKDILVRFYKKDNERFFKNMANSETLKKIAKMMELSSEFKSRIFVRLIWNDKDLSIRSIVVIVNCIEFAQVQEIGEYFDLITKIIDYTWPHLRKNIETFMKEILEVFKRRKERSEIFEWRECARKLQKLADHSIPLRRWLIANKKKWDWLPQYYSQTRTWVN